MKSALEKVVFFECRLDQLNSDLGRAREEIDRLKVDLTQASQREVALRQELAAAEVRSGQASRERDDALEQAQVARAERERFLDRLIEAEHIRVAGEPGDGEGIDLAAFIAELRSEIIALRAHAAPPSAAPPQAEPAPNPGRFRSAENAARALAAEGRIGISDRDREQMQQTARFQTRSEETLFALSLRELASTEALSRARAAQRLKALSARAALPAAAAALNGESDPRVRCALLEVLGAAGDPSVLPLVQPHLGAEEAEVRLAALECAFALSDRSSLLKALLDPSARVRRRAAVLAAGEPSSVATLEKAARDSDPSVRRVAALGMAAVGGARSEEALLCALDDDDASVRRAAAKGLAKTFGPEAFAIADLDAARRHREIRRFTQIPAALRRPVPPPSRLEGAPGDGPRTPFGARQCPRPTPPPPSAPPERRAGRSAAPGTTSAVPAKGPIPPAEPLAHSGPPVLSPELEDEVMTNISAALRGKSPDELVRGVAAPAEAVLAAAMALEKKGRLIRRGQRYFLP